MGDLSRFVSAQAPVIDTALAELRAGRKKSHWMWFVFPQIAGLGQSDMARRYAIADIAEARDYLAHRMLGPRLADCTDAMLDWVGTRDAQAILGATDALKFRSSMTLFGEAGGDVRFAAAIEAFYAGEPDQRTLALLNGAAG